MFRSTGESCVELLLPKQYVRLLLMLILTDPSKIAGEAYQVFQFLMDDTTTEGSFSTLGVATKPSLSTRLRALLLMHTD